MNKQLVIVGGGLAGLATAVALAPRGFRITLLESRPRLGGRASSFVDQATGTVIDNCQHVNLGCCTNFQHFCATAELSDGLRWERRMCFVGPDGSRNFLAAAPLPAPLHLLPAFAGLRYLSWRDKWHLAWGLRALARSKPSPDETCSFLEWLREHHQTETAINRFWHVVLVSALSETLDRIDVRHARKVFVDGFVANRRGWEMQVPTKSLDELYTNRLTRWLERHDVEVKLQAGVKGIAFEDGAPTRIILRNGTEVSADHVVLAVPHGLVADLLPADVGDTLGLARLEQIEAAPISSVHLWFDRPIMDLPHAVLVDRLSQWVFNRELIQDDHCGGKHYYQVIISASRVLKGTSQEETIARVVAELAEFWPIVNEAKLEHSRLITEHKAVFSPLPGVDALRPSQRTPIPNLHLAGDWTQTGWPATMEGAVRSGYLAAESVLESEGRPETILQPDLPTSFWPKLLFGLSGSTPKQVSRGDDERHVISQHSTV